MNPIDERSKNAARRDLRIFGVLVVMLSAPFEIAIGQTAALRDTDGALLVAPLMWMPALAALGTRLVTRQPMRRASADTRSRRGRLGPPAVLLLPILVGVPAYAIAVATGLVQLDAPAVGKTVGVIIAATILNLVLVPGEELGWRAFMVPRLVNAEVPRPMLVSGLIWGAWHIPLLVWGGFVLDGPSPWISVALLMVVTAALGYVLAWQQLKTGSVWGPVALHVVWNVFFQAVLETSVTGAEEGLWLGEAGILTAVFTAAITVWLARPGGLLSSDRLPILVSRRTAAVSS